MKALVEYIAKGLVDHPEDVQVSEQSRGRRYTKIVLSVNDSDRGKVIGRGGRVANAMRNLANVSAAKQQQRIDLEIR
ncbi:MAG: KH domain-containing protein [Anaerolineales bacterium]|nr:KH domain-containing protein [Anaerolineales bacterium]MCB9127743.1 KH domain-containing protein [Ardenticatenales bacterium]